MYESGCSFIDNYRFRGRIEDFSKRGRKKSTVGKYTETVYWIWDLKSLKDNINLDLKSGGFIYLFIQRASSIDRRI